MTTPGFVPAQIRDWPEAEIVRRDGTLHFEGRVIELPVMLSPREIEAMIDSLAAVLSWPVAMLGLPLGDMPAGAGILVHPRKLDHAPIGISGSMQVYRLVRRGPIRRLQLPTEMGWLVAAIAKSLGARTTERRLVPIFERGTLVADSPLGMIAYVNGVLEQWGSHEPPRPASEGLAAALSVMLEGVSPAIAEWLIAIAAQPLAPEWALNHEANSLGRELATLKAFELGLVLALPESADGKLYLRKPFAALTRALGPGSDSIDPLGMEVLAGLARRSSALRRLCHRLIDSERPLVERLALAGPFRAKDFEFAAELLALDDLPGAIAELTRTISIPPFDNAWSKSVAKAAADFASRQLLQAGLGQDADDRRRALLADYLAKGIEALSPPREGDVVFYSSGSLAGSVPTQEKVARQLQSVKLEVIPAVPTPSSELLDRLGRQLVRAHERVTGLFARFLSDLDAVYVEIEIGEQANTEGKLEHLRLLGHPTTLQDLMQKPGRGPISAPRWVVFGDPGAGKTTLARHLCWRLAGAFLAHPKSLPLALYLSLPRLAEEQIHPFTLAERDLAADLGAAEAHGLERALTELAQQPARLWLLLDGLDEVAPSRRAYIKQQVNTWQRALPNVALAVLSRPIAYESLGPDFDAVARVQALTETKQRELLLHWVGDERANTIYDTASAALREACRSPLILTLLAYLVRQGADVSGNRRALFAQSIETLLVSGHKFPYVSRGVREPAVARRILGELALMTHEGDREVWTQPDLEELLRRQRRDPVSITAKLWESEIWPTIGAFLREISERSGILGPHDGERNPWRFLHRQLGELLAAEALVARGDAQLDALAQRLKLAPDEVTRWAEVLGFACEMQEQPLTLLKQLATVDCDLALRVLPEVEALDPMQALEVLSEKGWDGDYLRKLVARWRERGMQTNEIANWLWRQVQPNRTVEHLSYFHYALEELVQVDRERFFTLCGRWPAPELPSMNVLPAGEFIMGSPPTEKGRFDDELRHPVRLSAFRLAVTPVTNEEYERFDPGHARELFGEKLGHDEAASHPVVHVTWWEARLYAVWLGARLPTEAQWEYACRAGTQSAYNDGSPCTEPENADPALVKQGWFEKNSGDKTHPVGELAANSWGMHDLHGNVWEWCEDWHDSYGAMAQLDPSGPDGGRIRVVRGGSCYSQARFCRSARRGWNEPGAHWHDLGFRLAADQ
jgi:formylglycine-generating enzyme